MLRINTIEQDDAVTLVFEGCVGGDWVPEALRVWDGVLQAERQRKIVVDLHAVSYVSPSGRELLAAMHRAGATLLGSGALIGNLIREITGQEDTLREAQPVSETSKD
jgi:hypothetical protein